MPDLDTVVTQLNKTYGGKKATIRRASELPPLRTFPFNIPALDLDLGGGALWGRTTILAGAKGAGKSSSAMALCGNANQQGIRVYWFDLEKSFDMDRAKLFGMLPELTFVIRGELTAENVVSFVRDTIRAVKEEEDSRAVFVVDSIAGMVVEKLIEEDSAANQFGGSARVINQGVAVWQIVLGENQILVEINQLRSKMTMMGEPEMMPGGMAQEFWASATVWTRTGETLKIGTDVYGQQMKWTIKKSRSSAPKEIGYIDYDFATGFLFEDSLIAVAVELNILKRGGAWYELPNGEKIQGEKQFVAKLKEDQEFLKNLKDLVYGAMPVKNWDGLEPNW